ncbi:hypothetical protein TSUD_188050 [Trifolium subterraneum]|uniref:Uncharacterized protein n=1 Tax=Trifolium subterraneum TaxID=3900 RepID=A0A2Z6NI60_TRISU|nr:hypothetical protein TSUD_188050 [Trifolium subterraneum]
MENIREENRKSEIKALLQDMEATLEKKRKTVSFNPLPRFTLHKILSEVAPLFYSKSELRQIEKINQRYCKVMNGSTLEGDKKMAQLNDEDNLSYEEKRVKLKIKKKRDPTKHVSSDIVRTSN